MSNGEPTIFPTIEELRPELVREVDSLKLVSDNSFATRAASFIGIAFVAMILGLIIVPWMQTVYGTGRVIAYAPNERVQSVSATTDGKIEAWYVADGIPVKKGDILAKITDLDEQIMERLTREREASRTKLEATEIAVKTSQKNVERQKSLLASGLSSARNYELAQLEYAKLVSEASSAAAELARLDTRLSRQATQLLTAPLDGTIQKILVPQGGSIIKQGTELALLVPESTSRSVELYVKGMDMPLVSVGREVRLQFEGWPAIQFSGWPAIAKGTFGGTISVIDPSGDGAGNFRIIVVPKQGETWPDPIYLRQGVRVVGWILLDTVTLGWELWRQFNGFPPSLRPVTEMNKNSLPFVEAHRKIESEKK